MPQPPGIIDRVNYVVETWNNPCSAPWYVYIETAQPAALEALVALACFDVDDVVRYIFRPAGLRAGGHLRSGRKGKRGSRKPRLGERIRNKVGPLSAIKHRKVPDGVKTLWRIDGIGQRLLWWWLVIDVGTGFVYNWTSLLYKTEFCQMALAPGAMGATTDGLTVGGIPLFEAIPWNSIDYQTGSVGGGPFGFSLGPGNWVITAAINLECIAAQESETTFRMQLDTASGHVDVDSERVVIQPGETRSLMVQARMKGPGGFGLGMWIGNNFLELDGGILYVQGVPDVVPPPISFECNSILWPDF